MPWIERSVWKGKWSDGRRGRRKCWRRVSGRANDMIPGDGRVSTRADSAARRCDEAIW